jgi:hypothetical protein
MEGGLDSCLNLSKAKDAHAARKDRLSAVIDSGTGDFDPDIVKLPDRYEFGKWLYGDSITEELRSTGLYKTAEDLHAKFHVQASKILVLALEGDQDAARGLMTAGCEYDMISSQLIHTLNECMSV